LGLSYSFLRILNFALLGLRLSHHHLGLNGIDFGLRLYLGFWKLRVFIARTNDDLWLL